MHVHMCLCVFVRESFVSGRVWGAGVFDFKAWQMKPKTLEKLTKHTDPRWLMGQEK